MLQDSEREEVLQMWSRGESLEAGARIFEHLGDTERVAWAASLVAACLRSVRPVPEVEEIVSLASEPLNWPQANALFNRIRQLTLAWEASAKADPLYGCLLYVGECAAKVIYNASHPDSLYDADSGAWLAKNYRTLLDAVGNPELIAGSGAFVAGEFPS